MRNTAGERGWSEGVGEAILETEVNREQVKHGPGMMVHSHNPKV